MWDIDQAIIPNLHTIFSLPTSVKGSISAWSGGAVGFTLECGASKELDANTNSGTEVAPIYSDRYPRQPVNTYCMIIILATY